jgi:hypothetical protein
MLNRFCKCTVILLALGILVSAETIPAGTRITVRTDSQVSSNSARAGDRFNANLARDLVVNGKTIATKGTPVKGKVTYAKSSGRLHAPGQLTLRLTAIEIGKKTVPISTTGFHAKGKSHTKSNVTKIGGGAAAGALIGGLAGGGKGALIGSAAGAGAGTGVAAATGKEEAVVHAETVITFTTTANAPLK